MLNINYKDPLLQFTVYKYIYFSTNLILLVILSYFFFIMLSFLILNNEKKTAMELIFLKWYNIVFMTVYSNITVKKQMYYPLFYWIFSLILSLNIIGLIPFSFTWTSSFIITSFFSFIIFMTVVLTAIYYNKWQIFNLFLPEGVPLMMAPGVTLIEIMSFFARVFSLAMRLFANMMAGHALMKILIGFSWNLLISKKPLFMIIAIVPWMIVTMIMWLETLMAFLQAYVFLTLSTMYLNDVIHLH